jgi:hypothetical protein
MDNKEFGFTVPKHWDMMSPVRQEGEDYEHYKERLKILKVTEKIYKRGVNYTSRAQSSRTNN